MVPVLNPACVVGLDALVTKEFSPKPLCHPHSTRYFSLRISLRIHHNGKSTARNQTDARRAFRAFKVQCSYLLRAPFRGADGQAINLAPIRTYLSVSAHARVWRTIQDSNLKPIA